MAAIEKRQTPEGKISYRVRVRLRGYPLQTATFGRLTDAKIWAQHTEAAIREGRHFKTSEAKKHTLGELIDRYIKAVLPVKTDSVKFQQNQKTQLNWWKEQIGSYLLSEITPALVAEYRDRLALQEVKKDVTTSPATVKRYLAALSHVFTVAMKEWGWVEDNPLTRVSRPKESSGRVRFLSDDERKRLLDACRESKNTALYTIVMLAICTGARQSEILELKWQDVDLERRVIVLHKTKNHERRILPLSDMVVDLLRAHLKKRRPNNDMLFPNRKGNAPASIADAWEAAVDTAALDDFRFHDLRHSAASYLAMNGATLAEIAEVLGHKTLQMVKRYAHLSEAHTAKVVSRMNESIFGK